jgi:hypothetical protein
MADNYTQFSFCIGRLTKPEIKWIKKILSYEISDPVTGFNDLSDKAKELSKLLSTKINKVAGELEYWPEFQWELEKNALQIYAEESGNELNAAAFVHAFLATFRPKEVVVFGACYSCSGMRVDEFGGQDWIITAHDIISTGGIAHQICAALKSKKVQYVDFSSIGITIHKFKRGERK